MSGESKARDRAGSRRHPKHAAPPPSTSDLKRELRAAVRERRAAMSAAELAEAHSRLTEQLTKLVQDHSARSISCFLSTAVEPETRGLLTWAQTQGIEVLLPIMTRVDGSPSLTWVSSTGHDAEPAAHGILEPPGERLPTTAVGEVDLMLIPACAIDVQGMRLGWGLGYYDRCLAQLDPRPPAYAVVFDEEVLPEVPSEPHDQPITGWVTPTTIARSS